MTGASLADAVAYKDWVLNYVRNDLNGELVSLYRVVQNHLEEFVRQFKWALSSRQIFE